MFSNWWVLQHAFIFVATKLFLILCHERRHSFLSWNCSCVFIYWPQLPLPPFLLFPHYTSLLTPPPIHSFSGDTSLIVDFLVSLFYFSPVVFMELYLRSPELYMVCHSFKAQHPTGIPQVRWLLNNFHKNISTILQE